MSENNGNSYSTTTSADQDREVIRCKVCGLVQYRTRVGNCRRCLRLLPPKVEFLISPQFHQAALLPRRRPPAIREVAESRNGREHRPAHPAAPRISRDDAEPATGIASRVSRSYLSLRIESGQDDA